MGTWSTWGRLDKAPLQWYLDHEVRVPQEEMWATVEWVMDAVREVMDAVAARDPRFGSELVLSGSYSEHLKVDLADEFDFLVPLAVTEGLEVGLPSWGDAEENAVDVRCAAASPWNQAQVTSTLTIPSRTVIIANQRVPRSTANVLGPLIFDDTGFTTSRVIYCATHAINQVFRCEPEREILVLDPRKLMQVFQERVRTACKDRITGLQSGISVDLCRLKPDSPAVTLTLRKGEQEVTVDLVPSIGDPFPPDQVEWPRRWTGEGWPSLEKITAIKGCGVDVVAKKRWRLSFSRAERVLMTGIDADGGHRRDSLKILKKIYQDRWRSKKVLCSYHLKTALFWACEELPESEDWKDLVDSFKQLVDVLAGFLRRRNLPLYFLPSVNLLAEKKGRLSVILDQVQKLQEEPIQYMRLRRYLTKRR